MLIFEVYHVAKDDSTTFLTYLITFEHHRLIVKGSSQAKKLKRALIESKVSRHLPASDNASPEIEIVSKLKEMYGSSSQNYIKYDGSPQPSRCMSG